MSVISHQNSPPRQAGWRDFLPLAITLEDKERGCVAGIDADGTWLRPSPVPAAWIDDPAERFRYQAWSRLSLLPHPTSERPEDRLIGEVSAPVHAIDAPEYRDLLAKLADPDVNAAFAASRSAGLVRARIESIYARRHTRSRSFLRLVFDDGSGECFDWIMPEVATCRLLAPHIRDGILDPGFAETWLNEVRTHQIFLAVGLTFPTREVSGRFGGCQPLVVGLHRAPPSEPGRHFGRHA